MGDRACVHRKAEETPKIYTISTWVSLPSCLKMERNTEALCRDVSGASVLYIQRPESGPDARKERTKFQMGR